MNMNKLTIPTILMATVMIAGIFAFMPVDNASAVHTTIQATQMTRVSVLSSATLDDDGATTCTSDADFTVFIVTSGPEAADTAETITIVHDGITTVFSGSGFESDAGQGTSIVREPPVDVRGHCGRSGTGGCQRHRCVHHCENER